MIVNKIKKIPTNVKCKCGSKLNPVYEVIGYDYKSTTWFCLVCGITRSSYKELPKQLEIY